MSSFHYVLAGQIDMLISKYAFGIIEPHELKKLDWALRHLDAHAEPAIAVNMDLDQGKTAPRAKRVTRSGDAQ